MPRVKCRCGESHCEAKPTAGLVPTNCFDFPIPANDCAAVTYSACVSSPAAALPVTDRMMMPAILSSMPFSVTMPARCSTWALVIGAFSKPLRGFGGTDARAPARTECALHAFSKRCADGDITKGDVACHKKCCLGPEAGLPGLLI